MNNKSKENSARNILESKIHQSFTVAADELLQRGYIDRDQRISLSSFIGDALGSFGDSVGEELGEVIVDEYDVDWIASKEKPMKDEIETKDLDPKTEIHDANAEKAKTGNDEKMRRWTSAKDFEEYKAEEEAHEVAEEIMETASAIPMFAENIFYSDEADKPGKISSMLDQAKARFVSLFSGGSNKEKEDMPEEKSIDDGSSLLITKNANGRYVWLARYSNNVRDIDNPPEIISAKSHARFVEMVDKGIYPMPELWIWHVKEWKIGTASVVDFDIETGFAIAAGLIDEDKHEIAKSISAIDPTKVRVSHGMPFGSIVRDQEDPTTIIEHQTKEISWLPAWAAANPLTGFTMTAQKEKDNMIDPKKSQEIEALGVPSDQLGQLEAANLADKAVVEETGIETKEKDEEETIPEVVELAEETPEPTEPVAEAVEVPEVKASVPGLEIQDIADVITAAVEPLVKQNQELVDRVQGLEDQVKALSSSDEEKIAKEVKLTPRESLLASVIGNRSAQVDGRTKEGKDGPKETPVEKELNSVGISVLGNLDNWRDTMKELSQ